VAQNKISVLIDVTVDKAQASLKSFRSSIADADGAAGKMKAGFAGATDSIKANAGALAATAGAALLAFGVKAVNAFTETALAAGKFSDATGIAVEDASRWMEVGGDVGIGADQIQNAIMKMNKALADGQPAFEDYGVEVVRTSDGMVDANATFQNALTTIGKIPDPTKRAQAAQQVFGRSYSEVARLMNMSATDLKAALDGVSDAKVIDESELKKAREFEAAMDTLKDSVEDVALKVGERLTPLIAKLAWGLDQLDKGADEVSNSPLGFLLDGWGDIADSVQYRFGELTDGLGITNDITVEFEGNLKAAQKAQKAFGGETVSVTENLRTFSDAAETAAMETRDAAKWTERLAKLLGELDDEAATLSLEQTFIDLRTAAEEAYIAAAEGSDDAAEKQRAYKVELNAAKTAILEYATEVANLPAEQVTQIAARLDEGNIAAVESALYWLTRGRTVRINGQLVGADLRNAIEGRGATGGIVNRPTVALIGEAGPEAVIPLNRTAGNSPLPGGMGGAGMTINITTGADPQAVIAAIKKFERANGTNWRS
jgi:hypothetical protein